MFSSGTNHFGADSSETKFKDDHLVLPVAAPLPHPHSASAHSANVKSGYQHDVLNSVNSNLHDHTNQSVDKYGDMSSLHLAHNRFLMPSSASAVAASAAIGDHFTSSATNPFSIHRFLPGGVADPKDVAISHYDYGQLGNTSATAVNNGQGYENMYYPPPLYPVHHATSSAAVHSNHL